ESAVDLAVHLACRLHPFSRSLAGRSARGEQVEELLAGLVVTALEEQTGSAPGEVVARGSLPGHRLDLARVGGDPVHLDPQRFQLADVDVETARTTLAEPRRDVRRLRVGEQGLRGRLSTLEAGRHTGTCQHRLDQGLAFAVHE